MEEDAEQAMRHHLSAADGGLAQAQHNVATHYFSGKGVEEVDLAIAAHYYDLAAVQGFVLAQINIGNMCVTRFFNLDFGELRPVILANCVLQAAPPHAFFG